MAEDKFEPQAEGEPGSLQAVLYFTCSECGKRTRFTAQDEKSDHTLACGCGRTILLEGDGLRGGQRKLEEANAAFKDMMKSFERLGK